LPTRIGREIGSPLIVASASDFETSPSSATADASVWVETSATQTYIRVDGNASGNVIAVVNWFDTANVDQGAPGVDEDVFLLNQRADSIRIYSYAFDVADDGITLSQVGTFTDNVFFSPTNAVNYGLKMDAVSSAAPGTDFDNGSFTIEITLRKAGFADLIVRYDVQVDTDAEGDF
jgi:hypothetical protein